MSGFIIAAFGVFFAVLIGLGLSLLMSRRRVSAKLASLEAALNMDAVDGS